MKSTPIVYSCNHCSKEFTSIKSHERKFCSQLCYQNYERPTEQLFWDKVSVVEPDQCWMWRAAKGPHGYGEFSSRTFGHTTANRVCYLLTKGEIPDGMVVMHSCDTPGCVNPRHLVLGTKGDNAQDMSVKGRGYWQQKTHCPSGHEYTEDNTLISKRGNGLCFRMCIECKREHGRKSAQKRRLNLKLQ